MSDDSSSKLTLVTGPISEPVTLAQAKVFLRIEQTGDDDAITRAITAARQFAESYLRKALLPQVWDFSIANSAATTLHLPVGPAQSIASVTLVDATGNATVMNGGNYRLSVDGHAVLFANPPCVEKLTVRFTASIAATPAEVPYPIVQGILHHVAVMMENRDGGVPLPMQAVHCYQLHRRVSL